MTQYVYTESSEHLYEFLREYLCKELLNKDTDDMYIFYDLSDDTWFTGTYVHTKLDTYFTKAQFTYFIELRLLGIKLDTHQLIEYYSQSGEHQ